MAKTTNNKTALSADARKLTKEQKMIATLKDLLTQAGDVLGSHTVAQETAQADTVARVADILKQARKAGLDETMLKASTEKTPNPLYDALVSAINGKRKAAGKPELSDGTRNNYMSRIRAYLRDRCAKPLDLFGNLAMQQLNKNKGSGKPAKNGPVTVTQGNDDADSSDADEKGKPAVSHSSVEKLQGVPAMLQFLDAWTAENNGIAACAKYVKAAQDIIAMAKADGLVK